MSSTNILQENYTTISTPYQLKLPLDIEILIPANDPVRLLNAFVEGMELSELYQTYGRIRKNQATPRQLLKIMIYANMNHIYSTRRIETACQRDINFMYLLEGMPVPDHATLARFISLHLAQCAQKILAQMSSRFYELGEISGKTIFIDGTKIESRANKYTFVWKKSVTKAMEKLIIKLTELVQNCEEAFGRKIVYQDQISLHTLKRLRKKLYHIKKEEEIKFVHGIGKRKTLLQKYVEQLEAYIERFKKYVKQLHVCGERNSYAKTDQDASFMRLKEDAMLNGQLKPAYNLQHGVDAEYITWVDISARPTDTLTLLPFLKGMESHLPFQYQEIVADAGYESEENYVFLKANGQQAYIKPQNYETAKTRKYKKDISRRENMAYEKEQDQYICAEGRTLTAISERKSKSKSGYESTVTVYECESCGGCQQKEKCIRGNRKKPLEESVKRLYVSKVMRQLRIEDEERIGSEYGKLLRMNRSIQVEGSFAEIKEDMDFWRYLYCGKKNVLAQSILVAMARNIHKLHHKIQKGRTGTYLFGLK